MQNSENTTVLIIAAHPDDEVLGCGGTLAGHAANGDDVNILIVGQGATSRGDSDPKETVLLVEAAAKAAETLGAQAPKMLGLPDNRLDQLDMLDVVKLIEEVVDDVSPTIVYTHHGGDLNIDHQIIHQSVVTACRPLPLSSVKTIRTFETVSSTEWASNSIGAPFKPNCFIDISPYLDLKLKALDCYHTEMKPFPHARSVKAIEALACLRGSQAGVASAEAFETILDIKGWGK